MLTAHDCRFIPFDVVAAEIKIRRMKSDFFSQNRIADALFSTICAAAGAESFQSSITRVEQTGGFTYVQFSGPNFSVDHLSAVAKKLVSDLVQNGHPDISGGIIQACIEIYLRSVLETTVNFNESSILSKCFESAEQLKALIDGEGITFSVAVRVLPEVEEIPLMADWRKVEKDCFAMSLKAHRSGMAAEEFLHRLFHSTTFSAPLVGKPDEESVLTLVESFRLSVGLALKRAIQIDEIEVIASPWSYYPSDVYRPMRMWGAWDVNHHSVRAVTFFSNSNFSSTSPQASEAAARWFHILRDTPTSHYTLGLIMSGIWLSLEASNFDGLVRRNKALQGMHLILTGLEGLILKNEEQIAATWLEKLLCKKVRAISPATRFKRGWRVLLSGSKYTRRQKNEILDSLYGLRNALAHGDFRSISGVLVSVKEALGDNLNPGSFDTMSVAFQLNAFCQDVFDHLSAHPELIWQFYDRNDSCIVN